MHTQLGSSCVVGELAPLCLLHSLCSPITVLFCFVWNQHNHSSLILINIRVYFLLSSFAFSLCWIFTFKLNFLWTRIVDSWFFYLFWQFLSLIDVFTQFTFKMIIRTILQFFCYRCRSDIFRSYDNYMFNFWGTTKYFFQSDYVILHSHKQLMGFLISATFC